MKDQTLLSSALQPVPVATRLIHLFILLALLLPLPGGGRGALAPAAAEPVRASSRASASQPGSGSQIDDSLFRAFLEASAQPIQSGPAGFTARTGDLDFTLQADGLVAAHAGSEWHFSTRRLAPVASGLLSPEANRLAFAFPGGSLWYRNTPVGLEQGFTLRRPPAEGGTASLTFEVSPVQGSLTDPDGRGVTFLLPSGERLRYDHLRAWDAQGKALPVRLEVRQDNGETALLHLQVDDRGAVYPLSVDPLIYLEQKLTTPGSQYTQFGYSVALDGDTALVGARDEDIGSNLDQGAAYVFTYDNGVWSLQQKLTASDGNQFEHFGSAVALDGDTALIGAPYADIGANNSQGAAYFFTRSGSSWTQQAKVTYLFGDPDDHFGTAVALDGDTALIGAPYRDVGSKWDQGSAFVFNYSGGVWSFQVQLTSPTGTYYDYLGQSVALCGDTALLGAPNQLINGYAEVFVRSGSVWNHQQKLTASDGAADDKFGSAVALVENIALIGAPMADIGSNVNQGAAYVFTRSGSTWSEQQKLTAADGQAEAQFGNAVALQPPFGYLALIGALLHDVNGQTDQGAAYVFTRYLSTWSQQARLTAPDGRSDEHFGSAVALSGNRALIGAHGDILSGAYAGSAYLFLSPSNAADWKLQAKLFSTQGVENDWFGMSVDYSLYDYAAVGAPYAEVAGAAGENHGKVYIFKRTGTIWNHEATVQHQYVAADDHFGWAVAIFEDKLLVGVPLDDNGLTDQGSVQFYRRVGLNWVWQHGILPTDAGAGDEFGSSLAMDASSLWIGAPKDDIGSNADQGSVYVYHLDPGGSGNYVQLHKFTPADGAAGDRFGSSVALSWGTALVGAPLADVSKKADQGAAYVYNRYDGTHWSPTQKLTAKDGEAGDKFGSAVSLSYAEDYALIGAPEDDFGTVSDQGSAYVFNLSGGSWTEVAKLSASDGATADKFGSSVAICRLLDRDVFLIGAPQDDISTPSGVNTNQGSVYHFEQLGAVFVETAHWTAPDGATSDNFGYRLACNKLAYFGDNTLFISAYWDDIGGVINAGSVYIFRPWLVNFLPLMLKTPDT